MASSTVLSLAAHVGQIVAASPGKTKRARIGRAARFLGLTPRRVTAWVYGDVADNVSVDEADRIRAKAAEWRARQQADDAELARLNAEIASGALRLARRLAARPLVPAAPAPRRSR